MNEIVNCEYSKTIMEEHVCNAFDVNRYGEIICSEENCIILKLKEQLQAKEQECEELKSENFTFEELVKTLDNEIEKLKLQLQAKEKECEELKKEKAEIKKYLGISDKTIIQRLEELQEFKDELKISEYNYKQALDKIEYQIKELFLGVENRDRPYCEKILGIINEAKDGE